VLFDEVKLLDTLSLLHDRLPLPSNFRRQCYSFRASTFRGQDDLSLFGSSLVRRRILLARNMWNTGVYYIYNNHRPPISHSYDHVPLDNSSKQGSVIRSASSSRSAVLSIVSLPLRTGFLGAERGDHAFRSVRDGAINLSGQELGSQRLNE